MPTQETQIVDAKEPQGQARAAVLSRPLATAVGGLSFSARAAIAPIFPTFRPTATGMIPRNPSRHIAMPTLIGHILKPARDDRPALPSLLLHGFRTRRGWRKVMLPLRRPAIT
jgi:hypothetical protein